MARDDVDFFTAVEKLAEWMNVDLETDAAYQAVKKEVNEKEAKAIQCHKEVGVVRDYLKKERGLSDGTIDYFMLGAYKGAVSIPFYDANGRCVGGAIRRFEGKPKYITTPNKEGVFCKQEFLYNIRGAKSLLTNRLYAVEGFFCAMSLHEKGLAAVAYNSSRPTKKHLQKIADLHKSHPEMTLVLVPDNDDVARDLLPKVRKDAQQVASNLPIEVLLLDKVKDVNEFFANGGTLEEFTRFPIISLDLYALQVELNKCAGLEAQRKAVESYAKTVSNQLTLLDIATYLSGRWNTDIKAIMDFLHVSQSGFSLLEDFKTPDVCIGEAVKMLKEPAVQTGISVLDGGITGIGRRKDVTFIGGYSGTGKTLITVGMACDMVVRQRKKVIYFSMEMAAGALYIRIIAYLLKKPTWVVNKLILDGDVLVWNILSKLDNYLYIVDRNGLTIGEIDNYIKEAKAKLFDGELDCIFIDYIQYMKNCSQFEVLAETAKGMKPLAKDNDIHVAVLSQLNRGSRPWEKPTMADLKGGGDLEASADVILLLWRPGADPSLPPEEAEIKKDIVMCGVGKARNGAQVEEVELRLDKDISRITMVDK